MSVTLTHSGLPEGMTRWNLLAALETTAKASYGLSRTATALFRQYVFKTSDADYARGRICAVWSQVSRTAQTLGLCSRSINAAERELIAAVFIARTTGANGARAGQRDDGRVVWAAGINLAPAIERFEELSAQVDAIRLRNLAINQCKAEIRSINQAIREGGDGEFRARSHEILPDGRTARITRIETLRAIHDALTAIHEEIDHASRALKTSDAPEENCAPNIQNNNTQKSCSGGSAKPRSAITITPRLANTLATPDYRRALAMFGEPDWPNIVETSSIIASSIGIDRRSWQRACEVFGREHAALCVIIVHRNAALDNTHPYHVRKPDNCLAGMIRNARSVGVNFNGLIMAMLTGKPE